MERDSHTQDHLLAIAAAIEGVRATQTSLRDVLQGHPANHVEQDRIARHAARLETKLFAERAPLVAHADKIPADLAAPDHLSSFGLAVLDRDSLIPDVNAWAITLIHIDRAVARQAAPDPALHLAAVTAARIRTAHPTITATNSSWYDVIDAARGIGAAYTAADDKPAFLRRLRIDVMQLNTVIQQRMASEGHEHLLLLHLQQHLLDANYAPPATAEPWRRATTAWTSTIAALDPQRDRQLVRLICRVQIRLLDVADRAITANGLPPNSALPPQTVSKLLDTTRQRWRDELATVSQELALGTGPGRTVTPVETSHKVGRAGQHLLFALPTAPQSCVEAMIATDFGGQGITAAWMAVDNEALAASATRLSNAARVMHLNAAPARPQPPAQSIPELAPARITQQAPTRSV